MKFQYKNQHYFITRYPQTEDRSLQAWSAADEYLLKYLDEENIIPSSAVIYNDRFGFLSCVLHDHSPLSIITWKSQEKALLRNGVNNKIQIDKKNLLSPLQSLSSGVSLALIKIPKSLDMFRLYLYQLSKSLAEDGRVLCSFMTRHFSPQMLEMAGEFFESVEQSLAWKKSRLLILSQKKAFNEIEILNSIEFAGTTFQQYFGVFSANNIDYASQFLIENLDVQDGEQCVLDLACGNGILAHAVQQQAPESELHLVDDSVLAVESAKLNVTGENVHVHHNDSLNNFKDKFFDLIVCNPPFHFEFENNIDVAISLFKGAKRCLKSSGRLLIVANQHLNYKTHLDKIFAKTVIKAENQKFVIYECTTARK
jgi:16S rRNA G1207 methylase RsmC